MIRIVILVKKTEFRFFVFWAAIIAFNWPFLTIAAQFSGSALFVYLLLAWIALIVGLCVMSLGLEEEAADSRQDDPSARTPQPPRSSG